MTRALTGLVIAVCLHAPSAQAQQIHKCVRGKEVTYQSEPCEPGQQHVKTWETWPGTAEANNRAPRPPAIDPGYLSRIAGTDGRSRAPAQGATITGSGGSACEAARHRRAAYLDSDQGRNASIDVRRWYNDQVFDACK